LLLLWPYPASRCLDLNAGKNSHLLANHVWGDSDGSPTNQVSAAFAQSKLNWASAWILQTSSVVPKQAAITFAASKPDVLLDLLLGQTAPCLLANLA